MKDWRNGDLSGRNTFGIAARCKRWVEVDSEEELMAFLPTLSTADAPLLVLGAGSNLLLTADYPGTVLHVNIKGREAMVEGTDVYLRCGAGETWDDIVAFCVQQGWHGAENLSLIPGEVGASAVQNIGAYGVEAKELIVKVEAVEWATARKVKFSNADCAYAYRQSRFKNEWKGRFVITHVTYRLSTEFRPCLDYGGLRAHLSSDHPTAEELRRAVIDIRRAKLPDPKVEGNAGSFFMNPVVTRGQLEALQRQYPQMPHYEVDENRVKVPAGWLIEQCGWKGKTLGKAGVHDRQALVLVNRGGATGADMLALCRAIQGDVQRKFEIKIEPEVNIV